MVSRKMNILDQFASLFRIINIYSFQLYLFNKILQYRDNIISISKELTIFVGAFTRFLVIYGPFWVPSPSDTLRLYSNRYNTQSVYSLILIVNREETLPS